ncbi:MAG: glycosyltransferase family 4 protein [Thermoproteota archaeon]|nr:glycosyltransferase family 4 protein [Thermoproteota archaeon]
MKSKSGLSHSVALLLSIYFPPEPGGGASAAWNRALILKKIGFTVFVICGFPSYPFGKVLDSKYKRKIFYIETIENVTVIRLRLVPLAYSGYLRRLIIFSNFVFSCIIYLPKVLAITGKINVVYSIAPTIFSSFIGFIYSGIARSFFVYEVSDLWPEVFVAFESRLSPIIMGLGKAIAKLTYMTPKLILAISNLAAEHITEEYNPRAAVAVFPIGVDPNRFARLPKNYARAEIVKKGILSKETENKFIVLYSGLISRGTAVENIAHAAHKLIVEKDEGSDEILFLIVGDGEGKQTLQQLKSKHNLTNLYLIPFQPRQIMPAIISASDVCIVSLPSEKIYNVDVPTKFYEYLAAGKPIIAINEGELANIINSNNIGRTVRVGETDKLVSAIKEFWHSPALNHDVQKASMITLQQFTLDTLATKLSDLLQSETRKRSENCLTEQNQPTKK